MPQSSTSMLVRLDLASGLPASRVLAPRFDDLDALVAALHDARRTATGPLRTAPLSVALAPSLLRDAHELDQTLKSAGFDPRSVILAVDLADLNAGLTAAAATLRARGWALSLRTTVGHAPALPHRDRALFREIVVTGALDDVVACPLLEVRLLAAKAVGSVLTFAGDADRAQNAYLLALGFDRRETRPQGRYTALARGASADVASSFSIR